MTFASPELLLALLLLPAAIAAYLLVQRRRNRYVVRFTNVDLLSNLAPRTPSWRRHVPPVLYVAAIAALVIALARPSMMVAVPREQATIVLTLDVSGSMQATDVDPSRLAAAQKAASDFVDQLPDAFRVGLVVFSSDARIAVAPTTDRAAIHQGLDSLVASGGTALGDALVVSLRAAGLSVSTDPAVTPTPTPTPTPSPSVTPSAPGSASASPSASPQASQPPIVATVLLSDGANSTGRTQPLDGAAQAAALGVPVYTIALGTADGVVTVPDQTGQLRELNVPPDPQTLAAIAEMTGGRFFEAPTAADLAQIYQSLGSKIGYTNEEREVTQLFAGAGLLLVLVGGGLAAHWFNRFP